MQIINTITFFVFLSAEDCNDSTSESLYVDAPGSSHMSSHNRELGILSVYRKGEGPLVLDGHNTLFRQVGNPLLIHYPQERLPLLQLQHTPIESTVLYDSMCH